MFIKKCFVVGISLSFTHAFFYFFFDEVLINFAAIVFHL